MNLPNMIKSAEIDRRRHGLYDN